jgi:hypothetical protein
MTFVASLTDVNDVAIWLTPAPTAPSVPSGSAGLFDRLGVYLPSNVVSLPENLAGAGMTIARVSAYDPDQVPIAGREPSWGVKIYSLDNTTDAQYFTIDNATGVIFAASPLVWNAQATFSVTVRCSDASVIGPVLSSTLSITVVLIQVNTVSVTSFQLGSGVSIPNQGVVVAGSPYNVSLAGNDVLVDPLGYVNVLLVGSGFGKTAARLVRDGETLASNKVSAVFGPTGVEFAAISGSCSVITANTIIQCQVPPGVGAYLVWNITVNGWSSFSTARMGYFPPTVSSVALRSGTTIPTNAPAVYLRVTGTHFGPTQLGTGPSPLQIFPVLSYFNAAYDLSYSTGNCLWVTIDSVVDCPAAPGVGSNFVFSLATGGNPSLPFFSSSVAYQVRRSRARL